MTLKVSTGMRNKLLDTGSLKSVLNLSFIKIYSGPVPATADAALDGSCVLLCTVSNNSTGTGLTMATSAASGAIAKNGSEVWSGTNAATGVASFYRHVAAGDTGVTSTTEARLQGECGLSGAEMNMTSTTLTSAATHTIDYYVVSAPTL